MLLLNQGVSNNIVVTLTEKTTISNPYYLFVFEQMTSKSLVKFIAQEREKPFAMRENDPLEWLRIRIRNTQKQTAQTADDVYNEYRSRQPILPVYC